MIAQIFWLLLIFMASFISPQCPFTSIKALSGLHRHRISHLGLIFHPQVENTEKKVRCVCYRCDLSSAHSCLVFSLLCLVFFLFSTINVPPHCSNEAKAILNDRGCGSRSDDRSVRSSRIHFTLSRMTNDSRYRNGANQTAKNIEALEKYFFRNIPGIDDRVVARVMTRTRKCL